MSRLRDMTTALCIAVGIGHLHRVEYDAASTSAVSPNCSTKQCVFAYVGAAHASAGAPMPMDIAHKRNMHHHGAYDDDVNHAFHTSGKSLISIEVV